MTQEVVPGRNLISQVSDGAVTPTWLDISDRTSVTVNRSENEEVADATTFDSDGEWEGVVLQRGAKYELEVLLKRDDSTAVRPPGINRLEALAKLKGVASRGQIRFRDTSAVTEWEVWTALVSGGEQEHATNDLVKWKCGLTRSGAATTVAVV